MPGLPGPIVKDRARRLRAAGEAARDRFLESCIGKTESVLVEQPGVGRTGRFAHVALTGPAETGAVAQAWIEGASQGRLHGKILS